MQVSAEGDGSQVLSWYAPENVIANADGSFSASGEPYKTAIYKKTLSPSGVRTTTVRRRQKGLPEHVVTRTVNGNIHDQNYHEEDPEKENTAPNNPGYI